MTRPRYGSTLTGAPPFSQDSFAAMAMRTGCRPSNAPHRGGTVVQAGVDERVLLGDERIVVALEEEPQRLLLRHAVGGVEGGVVRRLVVGGDAALGAEHLDALVVAIDGLAAVVDHAERTVGEPQRDDAGVHIAGLADLGVDQARADGADFGDLAAGQVADHVEIVDRHVDEDAAGHLDVGQRRSLRVARRDLDDLHVADAAALDDLVHVLEVAVKAAVEANLILHARALDLVEHDLDLVQIVVDRLFAEDVLAGARRLDGDRRVRIRRRADEHGLDVRVFEDLVVVVVPVGHVELLRQLLGRRGVDVGNGDQLRVRHAVDEVVGVQLADAAGADDADFQLLAHGILLLIRGARAKRAAPRILDQYFRASQTCSMWLCHAARLASVPPASTEPTRHQEP